jgi:tetratricopeptide (TPR) repeat protein
MNSVARKPAKGGILKTACIAGAVMLAVFLGIAVFAVLEAKGGVFRPKTGANTAEFYKNLILFDTVLARAEDGSLNPVHVKNLLETLDRSAAGAEARLSVLKRYRKLAKLRPEYFDGYYAATAKADAKYPHSALIAALYAEAMLPANAAELPAGTEKIRQTAMMLSEYGPLSEASLFPIAFCLYALGGDLRTADSASAVKRIGELFAALTESLPVADPVREAMLVNAALVGIVYGGNDGTGAALSRLEPDRAVLPKTLSFMAGYSYDFADPLLAAGIWARTGRERDIARAASALYIAGDAESARNLWLLLVKDTTDAYADEAGRDAMRSGVLYNLAATAAENSEKIHYLEQLLSDGETGGDRIPALTLYTRLLPEARALDILAEYPAVAEPLLDLEYTRRSVPLMPSDRAVAETWLLLNRHPASLPLYRWAAWYFEYQRRYDDLDALLRLAAQHGFNSPALSFHAALSLVRRGDTGGAIEALETLEGAEEIPSWQRDADLALIFDSRREYAAALRYYTQAADAMPDSAGVRIRASRLYLKMARCRRVLGEGREAVRLDLERAVYFDGENIDARLELRRLLSE